MPPCYYEYAHPEDTGKELPPFYSAWFLGGLDNETAARIKAAYATLQQSSAVALPANGSNRFAATAGLRPLTFYRLLVVDTVQELVNLHLVTEKRPNPKQRQKIKQVAQHRHPLPTKKSSESGAEQSAEANDAERTQASTTAPTKPKKKRF